MSEIDLAVAIVDDDNQMRILLAKKIQDLFFKRGKSIQTDGFSSAESFMINYTGKTSYDIVFLDIEMPGINGIELAKKLQDSEVRTKVIYVSNRTDKIFESLETHPYYFVRKQYLDEDLRKIVDYYILKNSENDKLILPAVEGQVALFYEDILYVESQGKKQNFHCTNGVTYETRMTFKDVFDKLINHGFQLSYKGVLVSLAHIKVIKDDSILVDNGSILPLSRRQNTSFKIAYMEYMQREVGKTY